MNKKQIDQWYKDQIIWFEKEIKRKGKNVNYHITKEYDKLKKAYEEWKNK